MVGERDGKCETVKRSGRKGVSGRLREWYRKFSLLLGKNILGGGPKRGLRGK